ncbi:DNA transformation protein [Sphaerotilus hippei]|uniref:DNA transformation protein n=1 Tax=Sphaerotilus hippei TaxID=744406 RepID=A0A318H3B6_9BURK|nr:TfoX/Sxy family protein [Sphaerotilus hippei]PXW97914.1 DNA transformation protein [Sphaerotilus hippei]
MSKDFVAWCQELLAPLGSVRARRMFGGWGLYADELFVALIVSDRLFLKADPITRELFVQAGCSPFEYTRAGGRQAVMSYFSAPDEAMDSPVQMGPWARRAMEAALRARTSRPVARPPATAARTARPARRSH